MVDLDEAAGCAAGLRMQGLEYSARVVNELIAEVKALRTAAKVEAEDKELILKQRYEYARQIAAVEQLVARMEAVPDHTETEYDRGRVDQRRQNVQEIIEVIEEARRG